MGDFSMVTARPVPPVYYAMFRRYVAGAEIEEIARDNKVSRLRMHMAISWCRRRGVKS